MNYMILGLIAAGLAALFLLAFRCSKLGELSADRWSLFLVAMASTAAVAATLISTGVTWRQVVAPLAVLGIAAVILIGVLSIRRLAVNPAIRGRAIRTWRLVRRYASQAAQFVGRELLWTLLVLSRLFVLLGVLMWQLLRSRKFWKSVAWTLGGLAGTMAATMMAAIVIPVILAVAAGILSPIGLIVWGIVEYWHASFWSMWFMPSAERHPVALQFAKVVPVVIIVTITTEAFRRWFIRNKRNCLTALVALYLIAAINAVMLCWQWWVR